MALNHKTIFITGLLLATLTGGSNPPVWAEVALPNGTVGDAVEDLRVKVLGGTLTVERQFDEGRWWINRDWEPAELGGLPDEQGGCRAYPELTVQDRTYAGDGQSWFLEHRYSVRATEYFDSPGCAANRLKTLRWRDRNTGAWADYRRSEAGSLQFRLVRYGDRNDVQVHFDYDADGRLQAIRDHFGTVVLEYVYTGGLLTEIRDNPDLVPGQAVPVRRVRYHYAGPLLDQVTDVRGQVTRYTYAGGQLASITDPEGRVRRFEYLGDRVVREIDAEGHETRYAYDYDKPRKQFYVRITYPATAAGQRVVEHWYDDEGVLIRRDVNETTEYRRSPFDPATRRHSDTDAAGRKTEYVQDEFGHVVQTTYPDGAVTRARYSALHGQVLEETDELGVKTRYDYDAKGNLLKKTEAVGLPEQRVTEYEVDEYGQVARETRKGRIETNGTVTPDARWLYEYDSQGQLRQATDPEGGIRRYGYDQAGHLVQYIDPLGHITHYEVDAQGNLIRMTDALGRIQNHAYDKTGNLITYTDARGHAIQYTYDALNRRIRTTNPVGGVYQQQYNEYGLPVSETDEDGRTYRTEFDDFLRIVKQTDALGNTARFGYQTAEDSAAGRSGSLTYPTAVQFPTFTQETEFDRRDRPILQILKNPTRQGIESLVDQTAYDLRGQVVSQTDANGHTRTYRYNALGQRIEATDALGGKTKSKYDARGNLMVIRDARGHIYRFEYDLNDRLVKQTLPLGQVTTYAYDAAGNRTEKVDPRGDKFAYAYDAAHRLIEIKQYRPDGTLLRTTTQTWDANDNLIAWTDTDATRPDGQQETRSTALYDDANRKTQETVSYPTPSGAAYSLTYGYRYSAAGKKTRLTWPDGTAIDYSYSAHGELELVTLPGEGILSVNQFKWIAPEKVTLPGGTLQNQTFDGLLNLEVLKVRTPGQQTVLELNHQYGKVQELKSRRRTDMPGTASKTVESRYEYDAEMRLTQAITEAGELFETDLETFTLDPVGNRIAHSKVIGPWTYDANNRLTEKGILANATSYEYDQAGNLTKKTEGAKATQFIYDALNRPVEVQDGNHQLIARYGYDPQDRRLWKEQYRDQDGNVLAQAKRTYYLYADEGLIAEATQAIALSANGSVNSPQVPEITTQYGPRPGSEFTTGTLFLKTRNSAGQETVAYYHHDHLGTPILATDKDGDVVWRATYEPFGEVQITTPSSASEKPSINSNLRLPGQYEDQETGLYYNFRRYYDPETGRYLTQDPIGLAGGINLYAYVRGNPLLFIDPEGTNRKKLCSLINVLVHLTCDIPHKCTFEMKDCFDLKARLITAKTCLGLRIVVQVCHGNRGTPEWDKHQRRIDEERRAVEKCNKVIGKNCCSK